MISNNPLPNTNYRGRVLIVAGSDPGGGAGIQGDIKTVTVLGGYAEAAITALTAQNTQGVFGIHDVPVDFVRKQVTLVLEDLGADAIKTGMLHRADIIEMLAHTLAPYTKTIPLVLDPVMFAKGGAALLKPDALAALKNKLIPLAHIVTPNIPEAEYLSGMKILDVSDMKQAAYAILSLGCKAVLLKGGHLEGERLTDILVTHDHIEEFTGNRLHTRHTHGTGCTLASAIATGLAQGMPLLVAVTCARHFVHKAMEGAPGFGQGHGPLGHHKVMTAFSD
jgi:hydroxymethylpyrimidine/phosphomethylpyrimidine kinase